MNEITRIHIARMSYEIDVIAKRELEKYLVAVRNSLGDEIDAMEDIEIRMTEILAARGVVKDSVITENDVQAIIDQLGEPADFSGEEKTDDKKNENWRDNVFTRGKDESKPTKKFYRDTENGILGGVVAGLAAYTGWDVTALRIITVILVIFPSFGSLILVYIVVWIVAPAAETASEKLEMRGEPVDIESIKEQVKSAGERVVEFGKGATEKVKKNFESEKNRMAAKEKSKVNPIVHGILAFFGIVFLIGFVPALIGFVITMAVVISLIFSVDIVARPLFIVSVMLVLMFVLVLIINLIALSVSMIRAKFNRGFIAGAVMLFLLLMGASVCSGIWMSRAGSDGLRRAGEIFSNELNIHVKDQGDRVKVDIGPIKINVDKN